MTPPPARRARIALDGHMIGTRETGNETYAIELALALARPGHADRYSYLLYTGAPGAAAVDARAGVALPVRLLPAVPAPVRLAWIYPRLLRRDGAALLHLQYVAPPVAPCPIVLSVHDVSHRIYPRFFSAKARLVVIPLTGLSLRRAAHIVAPSECTRRDLTRFYRVPPARVSVVPLAAGGQYRPQPRAEIERVRHAYGLPESYVLSIGSLGPRKNLVRLVEAFGAVADAAPEMALVIAGSPTPHGVLLEQTARRLGLGGRVRFLGYVAERDLPALYAGATVFCYPSLYEGFGLPPLEALACGTPVITANTSSLPEVVGDAGVTVDPRSVPALAAALSGLLQDSARREEYRGRGLRRATAFSWERTAALTRAVYDRVLGAPREHAD